MVRSMLPGAMRRLVAIGAVLVALGACSAAPPPATPSRSLGPGERWLPVANWYLPDGGRLLCAGVGLVGDFRLHGSPDDPRLVWMIAGQRTRTELAWPAGYSVRFTPNLELLDDKGNVVGADGTSIVGQCGTADPGVMSVELATQVPTPTPSVMPGAGSPR